MSDHFLVVSDFVKEADQGGEWTGIGNLLENLAGYPGEVHMALAYGKVSMMQVRNRRQSATDVVLTIRVPSRAGISSLEETYVNEMSEAWPIFEPVASDFSVRARRTMGYLNHQHAVLGDLTIERLHSIRGCGGATTKELVEWKDSVLSRRTLRGT